MSIGLQCKHSTKNYRIQYRCSSTGDYFLELCSECYQNESKDFVIKEELL